MKAPHKGFTLIELLVVIAIIAILAAILFPVFAKARERANATACISNEKQIGIALTQYANDYDEKYPPERIPPGWTLGKPTWKDALDPLIKSKNVWVCPSNQFAWANTPSPFGVGQPGDECGRFPRSYAYNGDIFYQDPTSQFKAVPLSRFKNPSGTILFVESRASYSDLPAAGGGPAWAETGWIRPTIPNPKTNAGAFNVHSGMINFIFADTHVQALKLIKTLVPQQMWSPDPTATTSAGSNNQSYASIASQMLPEYQ
ncbi:MAG TPA: prepilin-type N-terminal cleavage/methylation domain-containing protein [Armatimonadota bacterium]|jgi:prepilin-type N-terminal cleavage/methylation domain-containing protein/prepilin-type processing-associated H-X9-DG protein